MTWNTVADSKANVTAFHNKDRSTTVMIGAQNAILDDRRRISLGVYLLSGSDLIPVHKDLYASLKDDEHWRVCVEDAGVDNWDGYYHAMQQYRQDNEDDDE